MATTQNANHYGGQLTPQTVIDSNKVKREIQYRLNSQAHVPTKTNYTSGNYIGQDGLDIGAGKSHDTRQLNSQRGLNPSIQGNVRMTVATGMTQDMKGGTFTSLRNSHLGHDYGYSNPKSNLTGMNPRNLGVLNYNLYEPKQKSISIGSESARILRAENEPATSLASRIKRVGGSVR